MVATCASRGDRVAKFVLSHICAIRARYSLIPRPQTAELAANLQGLAVPARHRATQNRNMPELLALQRICGLLERGEIDSAQFLELFTRRLAADIGCSRAGVRMLIGTDRDRGAALRSMAMHDTATNANLRVPDMTSTDPSPYFDTLLRDGSVMAADCKTHPATAPFLESYLDPMDVQSLLDVSFSVNGAL